MFQSSSDCATGRCRKTSSIHFTLTPEGYPACARAKSKQESATGAPTVSARLSGHVTLEAHANGQIIACFDGYSVGSGNIQRRRRGSRAGSAHWSAARRRSRPAAGRSTRRFNLLVRRLARRGLLEYRLRRSRSDEDHVVIEPQVADYWPATPQLDNADVLVLSRFAYMRRRGNEMVLESPRAGALFRICNPKIATRHRHVVDPTTNQTAASAGWLSGSRASRPVGRLPNPVQDRRSGERGLRAGGG